jgi:hypothetical protein
MHGAIQISLRDLIAGCVGASSAVFANLISFVMIGKINERVPESERISYLWWGTGVRRRFKELYPGNKLAFLLDSCVVLMILSFVFLIWRDF